VFGPFKGPAERMPGTRLLQLLAPDGQRLYTLYSSSRPGYAPHDAPIAGTAARSAGRARKSGLGVSSDGASVYTAVGARLLVLDGSGVELETESLPAERVFRVTPIAS